MFAQCFFIVCFYWNIFDLPCCISSRCAAKWFTYTCIYIYFFQILFLYVCVLSCFTHIQLFMTLWTIAHHAPLSMGFFRQEYWNGLSCSPPGDLPDPGDQTWVSCISCLGWWVLYHQHHLGSPILYIVVCICQSQSLCLSLPGPSPGKCKFLFYIHDSTSVL